MTALYTIGTYADGIDASPFAIVADDSGADYVSAKGPIPGLDATRVQDCVDLVGVAPTTASGWAAVAAANMIYVGWSVPVEADDLDAARTAAQQALSELSPASEATDQGNTDTITNGSN